MRTLDDLRASDDLWNPYDFANPVGSEALFAGRQDELADICYYLRLAEKAPRPINLVLTGPRSSGKTSLLNKIEHESKGRGFCVVRVDLNEGDADPLNLFYKVYDAILTAAVTDGAFAGLTGDVYAQYRVTIDGAAPANSTNAELLFPRHFAAASGGTRVLSEATLKADLHKISQELGKPCVVLFDECDVLATSRIELEIVRNVFMSTAGYMLVMAGTPNLFPVLEDVFSQIVRQFKKIPVEHFAKREDTVSCIEKPLRSLGLNPQDILDGNPDLLCGEVHRLSAGRPYEIQLLCHYMFRRVEDGRSRRMAITLDLLEDVRRELDTQEGGASRPIVSALRRLTKADLKSLVALTAFRGTAFELVANSQIFDDEPIGDEEAEEAVQNFLRMGVLVEEDQRLRFAGDQFDEVYARYLAASKDMFFYPMDWDFEAALSLRLRRLVWEDATATLLSERGTDSAVVKKNLEDALAGLTRDDYQLGSLPDATEVLYGTAIRSIGDRSISIVEIHLSVLTAAVSLWVALSKSAEAEFLSGDRLSDLSRRVGGVGGDLSAELFELALPDRETLLARVNRLASPSQLEGFAEEHVRLARELHDEGDYAEAAIEAGTGVSMNASPYNSMVAAHVNLLAGDAEAAERYAGLCRELTAPWEGEDLEYYGFATYDLAVARCLRNDCESAIALLEESVDVATYVDDDAGQLAVMNEQGKVELEEDASLASCAQAMLDRLTSRSNSAGSRPGPSLPGL